MKHAPFISVTGPAISGYFAVLYMWNGEYGGFEPYQTGLGRYQTKAEAVVEAKAWAVVEELEYIG